ncbi:MAG: alkyl hydroperoxide reductase/thiol specific antioxidant/Mal allergen [Parcubacteria group bacterium Gr01-1014_33]|nr:MAG: alkyl hydroperoxide reductase/thiol specific antioxidant/Mal allergen [Parcubacteria group bacterium Gr01-1014_33]
MKKTHLFWAILIFFCVLAAGFFSFRNAVLWDSPPPSFSQKQEKAPDFSLQDFNGEAVSVGQFAGKPFVLTVWAAWCPSCKKELLDFAAVTQEFGDRVAFIAVNRKEPQDTVKRFADEIGITNSSIIFLLDPEDLFYPSIKGFAMPEAIFVDKDGIVRAHTRGPMEREEIRRRVEDLRK